jgi:staphylococcal nuclease domain-containing protein 1
VGLSTSSCHFEDLIRWFTRVRNVAEQLIEKGLASVVRHKRDDEDRSPDFDKLVAAEHA